MKLFLSPIRRHWWIGWACSLLLHGTVLGGLLIYGLVNWLDLPNPSLPANGAAFEARWGSAYELGLDLEFSTVVADPVPASFVGPIALPLIVPPPSDARAGIALNEADVQSDGLDLTERVRQQVLASASQAVQATEEENRRRLENMAGKLNRVSSEQTVDEMAAKLQQWLGTSKRAEKPAEGKVAGEFDFDTAQPHNVVREKAEEGGFRYRAVLVDAEGRTFEVELEEAVGESTYRTMQLLKSNPLAELVYRRILMSLVDKIIKEQAPAKEPQREPEVPKP